MNANTPIVDRVRAALAQDPHIHHAAEVAVSERAGRVQLRGTVRSLHQRQMALRAARGIRGVQAVDDGLRIDPRDRYRDAELRGTALQALIADEAVPDEQIDVEVAELWITLKGRVRRQAESDAAFAAVAALPEAGGVTNRITVSSAGLHG
jgi:osmotically-inducible protein OsmY